MALSPGTKIGHYSVTALLGEGGMGQVWQATDTQLNRAVALKILPDAFATDPDRLARFTREAQILASLNHPNIAAIYGIEETEGTRSHCQVEASSRFSCPRCWPTARIDHNILRLGHSDLRQLDNTSSRSTPHCR